MKHKKVLCLVLFAMSLFSFLDKAWAASELYLDEVLTAEQPGDEELYGFSMAADSRWLLISAKFTNLSGDAGQDAGVVYVYRKNFARQSWEYYQTLSPLDFVVEASDQDVQDSFQGAEFGESLALSHNRIAVGARYATEHGGTIAGQVYTYVWSGRMQGWVAEAVVTPPDGHPGDEFGRSVGLDGKVLTVGARFADTSQANDAGAVYVYQFAGKRQGWLFRQKLTDPDGVSGDEFGRSHVLTEQGRLFVGSREATDEISGAQSGLVFTYVFHHNTFVEEQILSPEDPQDSMYFGQSMASSGNLLVVGARNSDTPVGVTQGAAYVYRYDAQQRAWAFEQKLYSLSDIEKGQYGFSVALARNGAIAIGARRAVNDAGKKAGAVYMYHFDRNQQSWLESKALSAASLEKDDEFGQCLAMDPARGSWLVVGADQSDAGGMTDSGAAFYFIETP